LHPPNSLRPLCCLPISCSSFPTETHVLARSGSFFFCEGQKYQELTPMIHLSVLSESPDALSPLVYLSFPPLPRPSTGPCCKLVSFMYASFPTPRYTFFSLCPFPISPAGRNLLFLAEFGKQGPYPSLNRLLFCTLSISHGLHDFFFFDRTRTPSATDTDRSFHTEILTIYVYSS